MVETIAGGPAVRLVYTYNDAGQCSGVTASIGGSVDSSGNYSGGTLDYQNSYAYDDSGELTQIIQSSQTGGDAVASKEIDFTYNAAGQFQSITRYQGQGEDKQLVAESDYTYNSAGQLTGLVYQQGQQNVLASYGYTYGTGTGGLSRVSSDETGTVPFGQPWTPGGVTLPFHDPSQIDLSSLDQAPSPASLLASVTSADGTATYSYDALGELTSASCTGAQPSESYAWDANGNPTGSGYTIGADNEILSDGTYNYTYDADGNRLTRVQISSASSSDYETDYTWDNRNRLVEVTDKDNAGTITQTVTYQYDVENRWIGETVTAYADGSPTSVHTTDFVYDGNQIVLQFDKTSATGSASALTVSNLSHRYVSGPAVDQVLADEQLSPVTGGYNLTTPGNLVWTLTDQRNTVRDLATDSNGTTTIVNHLIYSSFGQLLSQTNSATGNPATVTCEFAYAGRPTDSATRLENDRARIYDAALMRLISEDPTSLTAGDTNLSRYCGNSSVNVVDPSGNGNEALTPQQLNDLTDEQFAAIVYQKALVLSATLQRHRTAYLPRRWRMSLTGAFCTCLPLSPSNWRWFRRTFLTSSKKYGDLLQKIGNVFGENLESISVVAANAVLGESVKTLRIRLKTGWSVWVRDTYSGCEIAIFQGLEITRDVKWFDASHASNSLLAKVGKVSGTIADIFVAGEKICCWYERIAGALKTYKGLAAVDLSGSLDFLQGAV